MGQFMILVCPSCDAKFKVPDGAIPAGGRTVRCAKCKNSWHAAPADIMRKKAAPVRMAPAPAPKPAPARAEPAAVPFDGKLDDKAAADAAALRRSVRGTLADDPAPVETSAYDEGLDGEEGGFEDDISAPDVSEDGDGGSEDFGVTAALKKNFGEDFAEDFEDDDIDPDAEDYDDDDFLARRRADQRRQSEREVVGRQRKIFTIALGGLVLFWVLVFYAFIFEQENMRHYFPGTSNFVYGIFEGTTDKERFRPEEGETLTLSPALAEVYVRAMLLNTRVETRDGQQGLVLTGFVENAGTTGANVPKVQALILDANGRTLDSWVFSPKGFILRRGGKLNFEEFRAPIPLGADKAEVKVIEGSKSDRDARDN